MTSEGPLYSDHVVVAAGTWSGQLMAGIGVDLPVYPVKGECFSVLTTKPLPRKTLFTTGCYIVPKAGGRLLVGATVVPNSYDRKVSLAGLAELLDRARLLMPAHWRSRVGESLVGSATADGRRAAVHRQSAGIRGFICRLRALPQWDFAQSDHR